MPTMFGFEPARKIDAELPTVAIVILSTHKDTQFIAKARESGASEYVDKQNAAAELIEAISKVASGEKLLLE
jgi:DNA-binding NarL/FixJ family response regulator